MTEPAAAMSFTKLVVDDLEAMARFYGDVYGLTEVMRFQGAVGTEPIDEIILGRDGQMAGLILFKYLERSTPPLGEVILGFGTPDLAGVTARCAAAGGTVVVEPYDPGLAGASRIAFLADPEGHLAEVIERAS